MADGSWFWFLLVFLTIVMGVWAVTGGLGGAAHRMPRAPMRQKEFDAPAAAAAVPLMAAPAAKPAVKAKAAKSVTTTAAAATPEPAKPVAKPKQVAAKPTAKTPAPKAPVTKAAATKAAAKPKPAAAKMPAKPDDLLWIKGVGPRINSKLVAEGITRFAQIAGWSSADVAKFDATLGFNGRIERDQWVEQARLLAAGDIAAFESRYGKLDSEN